jgi:hypothetical protein
MNKEHSSTLMYSSRISVGDKVGNKNLREKDLDGERHE